MIINILKCIIYESWAISCPVTTERSRGGGAGAKRGAPLVAAAHLALSGAAQVQALSQSGSDFEQCQSVFSASVWPGDDERWTHEVPQRPLGLFLGSARLFRW